MVYFNEPTVTKVSSLPKPSREGVLTAKYFQIKLDREFSNDFPPIVLCNDAWFDTNKVARLNMSTDAFVYSLGYTHYRSNVAPQISNISAARREFLNVFYKNKFRNLQNYYSSISIDLERASTKEDFYKSAVPSYSSSGDGPVKKILLPVYSICFSFPIQPLVGGLSLGFMFEEESILIKFADQTSGLFPASEDWFAFLGRDANSPFASPLLIKPFSNTVLKVKTQRFVVLAKKDAPCDDSKDSLAKCVTDCGSRLYKAARKCLLFWLSLDDRQQPPEAICNYFNVLELANTSAEAIVQAQWKNFKSKIKDCHKTCPRKCDRILHEMTLEAATNFNEFRTFDEIGTLKNHSNMTVAAIYVSHDAHGILTAEEVNAMSFTQLVNNVGGTLGLFVGGTLMTMAQLVLFCANHACRRRHNDVIGGPST